MGINTLDKVGKLVSDPKWQMGLAVAAKYLRFWSRFIGELGSGAAIVRRKVAGGKGGTAYKVPLVGKLRGAGVKGEEELEGKEEVVGSNFMEVTCGKRRHGVAHTETANWSSVVDLGNFSNSALGEWAAITQDDMVWQAIFETVARIFSGDAKSQTEISADDIFSTTTIKRAKLALQRRGGKPANVRVDTDGKTVASYNMVISSIDAANLQADPKWVNAQQTAGARGSDNALFTGALGRYNGVDIYVYEDREGVGSALRPECVVEGSLAANATTIVVGSADDNIDHTQWFAESGLLRIGEEVISYTGKTKYSFTGCSRAAKSTTAAAHTDGSCVTQNNLTRQVIFGAEAIAEALGQEPCYSSESRDYGERRGVAIKLIDGYRAVHDKDGKVTGLLVCESYGADETNVVG